MKSLHLLRSFLVFLIPGLVIFSCKQREASTSEVKHANFDSLEIQYYEGYAKLFPISVMFDGDNRYNDILPNENSEDQRKRKAAFYASFQEQLNSVNGDSLSEAQKLSYDLMQYETEMGLRLAKIKFYLLPMNQLDGLPLTIGMFASGQSAQPFQTIKDYDNWLHRLKGYSIWADSAIADMKKGIREKVVLPETLTIKLIPQFDDFTHGPVEKHLFYSPVISFPKDIPPADQERIRERFKKIIGDTLIPMYSKLQKFLKSEYLPASRKSSGINDVPGGAEWYQTCIKRYTSTDMAPDEIFALGESEVARIEKEMEAVKNEVGFKGNLKEFFAHLRTTRTLKPYSNPEQVLQRFREIHKKIMPKVDLIFNKKPKTAFEIRRVESFREKSSPFHYFSGTVDGSRPGIFYVPIPNVKEYSVLKDESMFLHEAIPGHHYQISLQLENTNLSKFRKGLGYTVYTEGWGLYAESLGKELGLYTDPYQRFGNLTMDMHRAIRLVVDAGIHSKGWTREQAIQYSVDHEPLTEAEIIPEIERYMADPGQALSYKIGQLKIIQLRKEAEAALGAAFNLAEFHDKVLETGAIPMSILEKRIREWIEAKKGTKG